MSEIYSGDAGQAKSLMDEQEVRAYWTEERFRNAKPLPLPKLPSPPGVADARGPGARAKGKPATGDAVPPDGSWGRNLLAFQTSLVADMTIDPYQTVGKLYMSFGAGNDFVGSAWTIDESAIFTAGHCVFDRTLGWATSLVFRAQYKNGSSIGTWSIRLINSLNGWINNGDYQHDMGAAIATSPIRPTTGASGWMANFPANQGPYTEIGYPAVSIPGFNFDGEQMWQSVGAYLDGSTIIKAEGNMTGGCSGGPWTSNNDAQRRPNGLNSHRYDVGSVIYSPYFGDNFLNLIQWIKDSGGGA